MAVDWGRIREIFDRAVEINPAMRATFLAEVCGDDLELRTEVEELLLANDHAGSFLHRPARPTGFISRPHVETLGADLSRIGPYQLVRELGRGGMGVVYLAERADGEFQKQVAIKVLQPDIDPRLSSRFRRERQILADLEHPNIARLIDGGTVDGMPYVIMEYVEGRPLRTLLKERGALPIEEAVDIARQIAAGLDAAHQRGIVHRDIKPENIMVRELASAQFHIKLLDFGISRLTESNAAENRTETGIILGTASYLSPEQAAGKAHEQIDARADVYSLGMVVYEMLTGRVAFRGESALALLNQHLHEVPLPPSRQAASQPIPAALDQVVLKALEKDRENRQQGVLDLARELEAALRPPIVPARKGRRYAIAAAAILLLGASFFFSLRSRSRTPVSSTPASIAKTEHRPELQVRILRQRGNETLQSIDPADPLQQGDRIHFEFFMPIAGSFYLLYETKDGAMIWANPRPDGTVQAGGRGALVRVPESNQISIGPGEGPQRFLALYVPSDLGWSLAALAQPESIRIRRGADFPDARLSPALAEKIREALAQSGSEIVPSASQRAGVISLEIQAPLPAGRILYHRLLLLQTAAR